MQTQRSLRNASPRSPTHASPRPPAGPSTRSAKGARRALALALFTASLSATAACDDPAECLAEGEGTLAVDIVGLPAALTPRVTLSTGQTLTESGSLTLPGGSVSATAELIRESRPRVALVWQASVGEAVCVRAGETATLTITYAPIPTSNTLWMSQSNADGQVTGFGGDNLGVSGAPAAVRSDNVVATSVRAVTFDREGNMWIAEGGSVQRLPSAGFAAAATPAADRVLGGAMFTGAIPGAASLAFDADGNLWVGFAALSQVARFTPDDLAASGEPVPAIILSGGNLDGPTNLAFDTTGNLWVAHNNGVSRFDAATLTTSSSAGPQLTLDAQSAGPSVNSLGLATGLAFDAAGNLWVAYFGPNIIARLTPGNLALTGNQAITPTVQISLDIGALLEGLAFDEEGGLWTPYTVGQLARLAPTQLAGSATGLTPAVVIDSDDLAYAAALAFYPAPNTTPLFHRVEE